MRFPASLAVACRKGGVGKSALVGSLASELASRGVPVTVADLDPQGSVSRWLGHGRTDSGELGRCLLEGESVASLVVASRVPGVRILPADADLAAAEQRGASIPDALGFAVDALESIVEADGVLLIDTAPSVGLWTSAALCACAFALVPVSAEPAGVEPLPDTLRLIERIQRRRPLRLLGVVANRVDRRLRHTDAILEHLARECGPRLCASTLPTSGDLVAAMGEHRPADPSSSFGRAIVALVDELVLRASTDHGQAHAT